MEINQYQYQSPTNPPTYSLHSVVYVIEDPPMVMIWYDGCTKSQIWDYHYPTVNMIQAKIPDATICDAAVYDNLMDLYV